MAHTLPEASALVDYDVVTSSAFVSFDCEGSESDLFLPISGNPKSQWKEQNNGKHLIQNTTGFKPTLYATGVNSINDNAALKFSYLDYMQATTASDWDFLSDGTSYTLVIVFRANLPTMDGYPHLMNTANESEGMHLALTGGTHPTSPNRIILRIYKSGGSGVYLNLIYDVNETNVYTIAVDSVTDKITVSIQNSLGVSSSSAISTGFSDASRALRNAMNFSNCELWLSELHIWNEKKSNAWVSSALDYQYNKYKP